jgi:Retrotransposon gag protein
MSQDQQIVLNELAQQKAQLAAQQQFMEQARAEINRLTNLVAVSPNNSNSSSSASLPAHSQGARVSVKPLAPSSFSGQTGNNANQWLTEFERYFAVTGTELHSANCVLFASTYLKDAASVWYTSKYPTMQDTPPNWGCFREAFLERFRPFAAERIARAQLRELRHRSNVTGYSDAFLKCIQHIPSMHVSDQIDAYIHGLQSHIAAEVDRLDPQSLSEAINAAQKEELRQGSKRGQRLPFYSPHTRSNIVPHASSASASSDSNRMDLSHLQQANFPAGPDLSSSSTPNYPAATLSYPQFLNAIANTTVPDQEAIHQQQYNEYVAATQRLAAMHQRPSAQYRNSKSNSYRAPEMPKEEYERCVKNRLCFRCKKSDHVSRHCPLLTSQPLNSKPRW